jgi:RNA polymerase sigma-70 factor (ECF subfamily)
MNQTTRMMNPTQQIWKQYHAKLHGFIQSRVGDPSIADDILQEVFARIYSRIHTLKDSGKIQNWIYQITRNAIIDHYRAHKTMEELPESVSTPEMDPTEKTRQEIRGWFLPMIESLPDHYRQALVLSEIEGLTQKEVAKRQGLSLSGAKARVRRGRALMKDMLLDCCRFEFDHQGNVIDYETKTETCDKC